MQKRTGGGLWLRSCVLFDDSHKRLSLSFGEQLLLA